MPSAVPRLSAALSDRLATTPIPAATIARLPGYLRALQHLAAGNTGTVSSGDLAEAAGVSSAQLRKDLSYLGSYGIRGVGYDVEYLRRQIGREMGSAHEWPVIVVGLGNLGTALANYSGFASRGFRIVAMVDPNPQLVGKQINGIAISDLTELEHAGRPDRGGHRRHRDPGRGGAGSLRPAGVSGSHQHPQLCSDRARRAGGGDRA